MIRMGVISLSNHEKVKLENESPSHLFIQAAEKDTRNEAKRILVLYILEIKLQMLCYQPDKTEHQRQHD